MMLFWCLILVFVSLCVYKAKAAWPSKLSKLLLMYLLFHIRFAQFFDMLKKKIFLFKLRFTPCKAEEPLRGMELQEKEAQKKHIGNLLRKNLQLNDVC